MVIHEIMKALVSRIQDNADPDAQLHFDQYPSLRTKFSLSGYTSEAAELDKDTFNSATLPKSSSRQTYVNMSLNFGTKEMTDMFPSLPPLAPPNPWKQTPTETQLTLRDEQSTVNMTDNSYATSLASIQSDLASMVTIIMTVNKQERAKESKLYEDRKANHEAQRKLVDDKRDEERQDSSRRMEKLEERSGNTAQTILQMMQQLCQGNGPQVQQPPSQAITPVPLAVLPPPQKPPQNSTSDMVDSLNQIKLNEVTTLVKKPKHQHLMDFEEDHPKLNGSPQTENNNENPPHLPPQGGQQ